MTIQEMHDWFDLVMDKVGEPYFTDDEKDSFLNEGQINFVRQFFDIVFDKYNAERSNYDAEMLAPLIFPASVQTSTAGQLAYTDLDAAVDTSWMYILNVARKPTTVGCSTDEINYVPSRNVRHNDFYKHQQNSFKKEDEEYPMHRYFSTYLQVNPRNVADMLVTLLKYPIEMDLGTNVSCELPEKAHNEVVFLALKFAGINMERGEFYAIVNTEQEKGI